MEQQVKLNATTREELWDRCIALENEFWREPDLPMSERQLGTVAYGIAWAESSGRLSQEASIALVGMGWDELLNLCRLMRDDGASTYAEVWHYLNEKYRPEVV